MCNAMQAVLAGRLPEGQVLSHDLLEGSLVRCAAVTDMTPDRGRALPRRRRRLARCTAGYGATGNCCPSCCATGASRLRAINRWKMLDNLRRSLVAPCRWPCCCWRCWGRVVSPWAALALVVAAFSAGPLMGAAGGLVLRPLSTWRDVISTARPGSTWRAPLWAVCGIWAQLLQQALRSVDAIVRALYRILRQSPPPAAMDHRRRRAGEGLQTGLRHDAAAHWSLPAGRAAAARRV